MSEPVFGRLVTAMVTPFAADGSVDLAAAESLANYLVDTQGNDALVINGTTGEAPTTTDDEKAALVAAARKGVGSRAKIIAGVGTNDTAHTIELSRQAEKAGADGLLVVTPYYSRPPQDALLAHFTAVADASGLPIMVYDIPQRTATPIETLTMLRLAEHDRIVAVKDAKGLLAQSAVVMADTNLAYYAGDDAMWLPLMAAGGVGVVGTSTHFSGAATKVAMDAFLGGDQAAALSGYRDLLDVYVGVFATQGVLLVKAGLANKGIIDARVRLPLLPASAAETDAFVAILNEAGL